MSDDKQEDFPKGMITDWKFVGKLEGEDAPVQVPGREGLPFRKIPGKSIITWKLTPDSATRTRLLALRALQMWLEGAPGVHLVSVEHTYPPADPETPEQESSRMLVRKISVDD